MKQLLPAVVAIILTVTSCNKDNDNSDNSVKDHLVGKWNIEKVEDYDFYDNQHHRDSYGDPGDYFEFLDNGQFKGQLDGEYGETT